jgi:hypothetical protein
VKRLRVWLVGLLAVAIAVASVSWTSPITLLLKDEEGRPASDAYLRFHYYGHLINPVHPVTYIARGSAIIRVGGDGRVTIPASVHFRRPLPLSTPPSAFIDHVYVPRLHNAFGPVAELTMSRPGVFTIAENRAGVTVADVSVSPEHWERSLQDLFDCIRGTLIRSGTAAPRAPRDRQTTALARELIEHLRREYAAFLAKYGQATRQRPPQPEWGSERDRQLWREQIDAQLAREPLWGPFMERIWEHHLRELDDLEAALK